MTPTESSILIAVIAGSVSVISAFIAWQQAVKVKKIDVDAQARIAELTSKTQLEIEKLKLDNDKVKHAFEMAMVVTAPLEDVLLQVWQAIQLAKDGTLVLLNSEVHDATSIKDAACVVELAQETVRDLFVKFGGQFEMHIAGCIHSGKNLLATFHKCLVQTLNEFEKENQVSAKRLEQIKSYRQSCTDLQGSISIERAGLQGRQIDRIVDAMEMDRAAMNKGA